MALRTVTQAEPSRKQAAVLHFIVSYRRQRGYSPTFREIGRNAGVSVSTALGHCLDLERKGRLVRRGSHRGYVPVPAASPKLCCANCGSLDLVPVSQEGTTR